MKPVMKGAALVLQLGLGIFWLYAGATRLWNGFDAAPFLKMAVTKAQGEPPAVLPFMGRIVATVALPALPAVDFSIPWLEIAAGLGLLAGIVDRRARPPAFALAGMLSVLFLACGASGWNPFLLAAVLFLALAEVSLKRPEECPAVA